MNDDIFHKNNDQVNNSGDEILNEKSLSFQTISDNSLKTDDFNSLKDETRTYTKEEIKKMNDDFFSDCSSSTSSVEREEDASTLEATNENQNVGLDDFVNNLSDSNVLNENDSNIDNEKNNMETDIVTEIKSTPIPDVSVNPFNGILDSNTLNQDIVENVDNGGNPFNEVSDMDSVNHSISLDPSIDNSKIAIDTDKDMKENETVNPVEDLGSININEEQLNQELEKVEEKDSKQSMDSELSDVYQRPIDFEVGDNLTLSGEPKEEVKMNLNVDEKKEDQNMDDNKISFSSESNDQNISIELDDNGDNKSNLNEEISSVHDQTNMKEDSSVSFINGNDVFDNQDNHLNDISKNSVAINENSSSVEERSTEEKTNDDIPEIKQIYPPTVESSNVMVVSTMSYFLHTLLFSIPIIGLIFLIIKAFDNKNMNIRNYARSYFLSFIVVFVLGFILSSVLAFGYYDSVKNASNTVSKIENYVDDSNISDEGIGYGGSSDEIINHADNNITSTDGISNDGMDDVGTGLNEYNTDDGAMTVEGNTGNNNNIDE